ncbi:MAG: phage portal protein [Brevundimonas sp.]|uniref:phage portal protein n=1 Tax=Brevundimonas sp. TaxID=1871086 RepID=UPI000DB3A88B|nr:phage portal protein [Brevundimonas sp.]PZT99848.1 MAG: phage portal protein [Brevundimonas sp.]
MAWPWTRNAGASSSRPSRGRSKARAFGFEASRFGRRLKGWVAERRNINSLLSSGGDQLRARARQLCRENPYAANALEAFASAAVGTGIKPSPLNMDAETKKATMASFLWWTDEADADGQTDLYGMQALAARAMFEAGECFIRRRVRRPSDGLSVPLQLQLLEAEMLPLTHNETLPNGNVIRAGIEFNVIGRRVAYHFLRSHPGEASMNWRGMERSRVPAGEVLHLYRPLRPGQIRGQPGITPGMVRLYLLDQYDDAELDRKRTAAMFAGFIKKVRPEDEPAFNGQPESAGEGLSETSVEASIAELQPGTMQVLLPGEEVTFSQPADVGGAYEAFQFRSLCAISAAVGLPYHTVSGDLSKANYGSQRGGQVEQRRRMDQFQHMTLIFQMCRPVWEWWLEAAVLVGAVPISPAQWIAERNKLVAAKHIPPSWPWVDPLKDRQAQALAEDRGWTSRSDIIEAEGFDPEEVDARIKADRDREAELGLTFSNTAAKAVTPTAVREDEQGFSVTA